MSAANRFFIIFLATILLTRVFLYFVPFGAPDIGPLEVHHYMYGLILIAAGYALRNLLVYAVGFALVVDELMLFTTPARTWDEYYSLIFVGGTIVFTLLVYICREQIVQPLLDRKAFR
jgi:hypothetical protein